MRRILLREPKDPFEVVSAERTLEANLIGDNSGNLLFLEAAHKILATSDATVTPDRFGAHRLGADRINERFDVYVVPLANAFRPSFEANLVALTRVIERLRIPVVVLGVGAQGTVGYDAARLAPIEASVRAFMTAVLDRSPSVGVRGEFTHDYLRGLGFRDVEVIGCPSMFVAGDRLAVERRVPALGPDSPIAMNVSPYVKAMAPIVASHLERYPDLRYIAQDLETLETLLWGGRDADGPVPPTMPVRTSHPLFQDRQVGLYVDPWPWIDALRTVDFSFGTRIHGNIAALLAGTPAVVLAHDSRTLELARYFEIPHRLIGDLPPGRRRRRALCRRRRRADAARARGDASRPSRRSSSGTACDTSSSRARTPMPSTVGWPRPRSPRRSATPAIAASAGSPAGCGASVGDFAASCIDEGWPGG